MAFIHRPRHPSKWTRGWLAYAPADFAYLGPIDEYEFLVQPVLVGHDWCCPSVCASASILSWWTAMNPGREQPREGHRM